MKNIFFLKKITVGLFFIVDSNLRHQNVCKSLYFSKKKKLVKKTKNRPRVIFIRIFFHIFFLNIFFKSFTEIAPGKSFFDQIWHVRHHFLHKIMYYAEGRIVGGLGVEVKGGVNNSAPFFSWGFFPTNMSYRHFLGVFFYPKYFFLYFLWKI